jgi:hypothetical protein
MGEPLSDAIRRLKADLARSADAAQAAEAATGCPVDRRSAVRLDELSDRELDLFVRAQLEALNSNAWMSPEPRDISTHRNRILTAPVVVLKRAFVRVFRFYSEVIGRSVVTYDTPSALAVQAMAEQSRRDREALRSLEGRVSRCEEQMALFRMRLDDPRAGRDT